MESSEEEIPVYGSYTVLHTITLQTADSRESTKALDVPRQLGILYVIASIKCSFPSIKRILPMLT